MQLWFRFPFRRAAEQRFSALLARLFPNPVVIMFICSIHRTLREDDVNLFCSSLSPRSRAFALPSAVLAEAPFDHPILRAAAPRFAAALKRKLPPAPSARGLWAVLAGCPCWLWWLPALAVCAGWLALLIISLAQPRAIMPKQRLQKAP